MDEPGSRLCPVADLPISGITMEVVVWLSVWLVGYPQTSGVHVKVGCSETSVAAYVHK
jgi:hypothetical protein